MRTLCAVALLFSFALPAIAEELRAVDPKTVIDGDTFYVSVRLLDVDAPEEVGDCPADGRIQPHGTRR